MKNLMNITDLTVEEIDELIAVAEDIIANPEKYQDACRHKLLATLFFEPSTRTRLSFESAMHRLGGSVVGFSEAGSSIPRKVLPWWLPAGQACPSSMPVTVPITTPPRH